MKQMVILICLFLFQFSLGQETSINKVTADYLCLSDPYKYIRLKKENKVEVINIYKKGQITEYPHIDSALVKEKIEYKDLLPVSDLKKINPEELFTEVKQLQFKYSSDNKNTQQYFNTINEYLGLVRTYTQERDSLLLDSSTFHSLYPLIINNKHTILLTSYWSHFTQSILPLKRGIVLKGKEQSEFIYPTSSIQKSKELQEIYKANEGINYLYTIIGDKGKEGMGIYNTKHIIIPMVYDKLDRVTSKYFIFGYKNNSLDIFFPNGEKILASKNIRAYKVYESTGDVSILSGNKTGWLDKDGKLVDKKPAPHPKLIRCGGAYIPLSRFILKKEKGEYILKNQESGFNKPYTIFSGKDYKDINFLNLQKSIQWFDKADIPLIVKNNKNEVGIIELKYESEHISYDWLLSLGNYNFEYQKTVDFPYNSGILKIEKEGLYGWWGLTPVKYKELSDFDKGFSRFKTVEGNYGWLSLDGKEYLDE